MIGALLLAAAAPAAIASGYLLLLTLLSRRPPAPRPAQAEPFFDLVVPAHDEEAGVAATVQNLLSLDWPAARRRVTVVADNCADATARVAAEAGARVLVRDNPQLRGKGHALDLAFSRLEGADAAVVVDADTVASPNLLRAFAARLGAGERALQADYRVRNPDASWRTRLLAIALGMFHVVRSRGREALRLSCGLRGNGMCFEARLLREVPPRAYSLAEDVEYGLALAEAGVRVAWVDEAQVYGEMVSSGQAAASQRRRWEEGRRLLARQHGLRLLLRGLGTRSALLLDIALDLLIPPLSTLAAAVCAGTALALWARAPHAVEVWAGCTAALAAYAARGWAVSGTGLRGLAALLRAPFYLAWKLWLALRRPARAGSEWVRTAREERSP